MVTCAAADISMRKGGRRGSEREETEEGKKREEQDSGRGVNGGERRGEGGYR